MTAVFRIYMWLTPIFCLMLPHFVNSQIDNGVPAGDEYHIPEGGSQTLNCSQSDAPTVVTWRNVTWILPNLTLIQRDHTHVFKDVTLFSLSEDGEILSIENFQPKWYGDYYCVVLHMEPNFYVTKFSLNTSYYYAAEMYNQYHRTVLILAICSGCLLALLTLVFSGILWCKNSRKEKRRMRHLSSISGMSKQSIDWSAYLGMDLSGVSYPGESFKPPI